MCRQRAPTGLVFSLGAQALLCIGCHAFPRPTTKWPMVPDGDQCHARPRKHSPLGSGGTHHPTQSPQGSPPAGGPKPGPHHPIPRPGLSDLWSGGLPPRARHSLPVAMDQAAWLTTGAAPRIWAIPTAHTQIEASRNTRKDPASRPQQRLICGYHAVHRVLWRVGRNAPLRYPLPTTNKEVHQVRTHICRILAAAVVDGKLKLQTSRPTPDHTCTPPRANTSADAEHANDNPHHLPFPSQSPPSGPHSPSGHSPMQAQRQDPTAPPESQPTPATDSRTMRDPPPSASGNPHTAATKNPKPQDPPTPPGDPHTPYAHRPLTLGPSPPAPECRTRELFPPVDTDTPTLAHARSLAQPNPASRDRSPTPAPHTAADQVGPLGGLRVNGP